MGISATGYRDVIDEINVRIRLEFQGMHISNVKDHVRWRRVSKLSPSIIVAMCLAVMTAVGALLFYGSLLSFPLIGEDGAANYISMLHAMRDMRPFSLSFGFKAFEGLGQINLFYTAGNDPFSWTVWAISILSMRFESQIFFAPQLAGFSHI